MKMNPNLIILDKDSKQIILKTGSGDGVVKMSPIEFEIIENYSNTLSMELVIAHFKDIIEIEVNQLESLILKAKQSKILVDENTSFKKNTRVQLLLKRNKRIFELFNIDFTGTYLEKIYENYFTQKFIIYFLVIIFGYFIYDLASEPLNFKDHYLKTLYLVPYSFSTLLIVFIYLSSFISTSIHEFGHYFIYKLNNGKSSVFGFGLLFFFIPVFYNKILSSLIKKKSGRIFVNAGGIIFDLLLFIWLLYFTKKHHLDYPTISFFGYSMMISIVIRSIFNVNIFLPNTDGYFIFADAINKPKLFEISIQKTKDIYTRTNVKSTNFLYASYLFMCFFSIAISWCMYFLPLVAYFYYASF